MKELLLNKRIGLLSEIKNLKNTLKIDVFLVYQQVQELKTMRDCFIKNQSGEDCVNSFILCLQQPY